MDMDEFIFTDSVSTLQKMSAHTAALGFWRYYISTSGHFVSASAIINDPLRTALELNEKFKSECDELISRLSLPETMKRICLSSMKNILNEIIDWICSFRYVVFKDSLRTFLCPVDRTDVISCFWTKNCSIDYERSISYVLSERNLSQVQKFIIICKYSMIDEITRFPLDSLSSEVMKTLREDILLNYWICQLRNETFTMPESYLTINQYVFRDLVVTDDTAMFVYCWYDDRFAFKYFWNRLESDEQVDMAVRIIRHKIGDGQIRFMFNLCALRQRRVVCEIPDLIMKNLIVWLDQPEIADLAWQKTKDAMTQDKFCKLVFELFKTTNHESLVECAEQCHDFLLQLWRTAPARLKVDFSCLETFKVMREFCKEFHFHSKSGFEFVLKLVASTSMAYRKNLLLSWAVPFVLNTLISEPRPFVDLLKLCLPSKEDRLELVRIIMGYEGKKVKKAYDDLLLNGKISELNAKLEIIAPNDETIRELKKWILDILTRCCSYPVRYITNFDSWKQLSEFIAQSFAGNQKAAMKFRKKILLDFARKECFSYWNRPDCMNEIIKVAEHGLPTKELNAFKKAAQNHLFRAILYRKKKVFGLEKGSFYKNILWCLGDPVGAHAFIDFVPAKAFQ